MYSKEEPDKWDGGNGHFVILYYFLEAGEEFIFTSAS